MADQDQQPTTTTETFLQTPEGEPAQIKTEDLVGEGKKFESTDALAYGKEMADRHIATLERENQLKDDRISQLESQGNLVEELKAEMSKTNTTETPVEATTPSSESGTVTKDINQLVRQALVEEKQVNLANQNLAVVRDRMVSQFGESWSSQGAVIAAANNMSLEKLNSIAADSPNAFFKLADMDATTPVVNQPSGITGTINTEAAVQSGVNVTRNSAYYKAKRIEMGDHKFFGDVSLQNEILKQATELGDAF